ncbi:MAG: TolC family protein [Fimbriimonas sp.]|nr:TolC family protein [Fimbriimonas sp.]
MTGRGISLIAVVCLAGVAGAQTKAPPPNAKDMPIPSRPTLPQGGADQGLADRTLSAPEAVKIALAKQPTLESVRQAVKYAEGRTRQLRAKLVPQLTIGGSYYSSRFMGDEPSRLELAVINGYAANASLTQLIFDSHHASDLVRQSDALKQVALQDLARAKADLALQVFAGYYLVGEARDLVQVNERNVTNRESQLELARSRFSSGLGGPVDVLTAQTAKGDAIVSLIQARSTEDAARTSLLQTLGLDPQTPIHFSDEAASPVVVDDYDGFVASALAKRPEIRRAQASIDAAHYGARAARSTTTPTLSSSFGVTSSDPGFPGGGGSYGVGLILSVPIYDGGFTAGAIKEAEATLKSAQADLATAQLQVRTDVSQAYLAVKASEQQASIAKVNVDNAREALRIAEGRYKSGVGLFLDIINAQAALLGAETTAASAAAEVSRQRVTLERAAGLLETP